MNKISSTERFSNVVENYKKYRPGYPGEIISVLTEKINLTPDTIIADLGSGTGKSSIPFLLNNNVVYGVEPNDAMRAAAELEFKNVPNFVSIKGTAEDTGLAANSIAAILSGQAFHWFDHKAARKEFERILKPAGWVVLVWNDRDNQSSFSKAYESFLHEYSTDYAEVNHRNVDEIIIRDFFNPNSFQTEQLYNFQDFDLDGLKGRHLSTSYSFKKGHPNFESAMEKLEEIFEEFEEGGFVKMEYMTRIYFGHLD